MCANQPRLTSHAQASTPHGAGLNPPRYTLQTSVYVARQCSLFRFLEGQTHPFLEVDHSEIVATASQGKGFSSREQSRLVRFILNTARGRGFHRLVRVLQAHNVTPFGGGRNPFGDGTNNLHAIPRSQVLQQIWKTLLRVHARHGGPSSNRRFRSISSPAAAPAAVAGLVR